MANNHNSSLYEIAKYSAASLIPQIAIVFLDFLAMLAITKGRPSSGLIGLTFCVSVATVGWLEWKSSIFFNSSNYVAVKNRKFQLQLLKNNVLEWNDWRAENLFAELDFQHQNLCRVNLSGANLSSANLRKANLSKANLTKANLTGVDRRGANPTDADRRRTNRPGADRRQTNLNSANLRNANLNGANLASADLTDANLIGTELISANLTSANLTATDLIGANLRKANLTNADLTNADLTNADLTNADLTSANFDRAKVRNCQFGDGTGLAKSTKTDLKRRGAVFNDAPGEPGRVLTPH
jgi:uncharacterized protein YjbI with pentapeptide repeats